MHPLSLFLCEKWEADMETLRLKRGRISGLTAERVSSARCGRCLDGRNRHFVAAVGQDAELVSWSKSPWDVIRQHSGSVQAEMGFPNVNANITAPVPEPSLRLGGEANQALCVPRQKGLANLNSRALYAHSNFYSKPSKAPCKSLQPVPGKDDENEICLVGMKSAGNELVPTIGSSVELGIASQVVDEVLTRRKETEWFIEGDFDAYVERIRKPYVWGGELELLMASHLLK
ncbi:OTU domain-containing protein [Camellia lanceoleosa]|uniref:OTU domain-containing protein n=1 Tax=Camellia lanceoleosa TaxID=1840588 RepID=A0ACC0G7E3_9ERIC|nr:OTU domain-containing protein [Camellia lanceoleosa]